MSDNLTLWNEVQQTDPKYAKDFKGAGGFSGTAVNPTWLAKRATEVFGPIGTGWGIEPLTEEFVEGHAFLSDDGKLLGHAKIHKIKAKLWYNYNGKMGEVIQYGQTEFVGRNKYGFFTDGDVAKKSLTDAMSKCLSLLGFSSDIYLQVFDGSKHIDTPKQVENTNSKPAANGNAKAEQIRIYNEIMQCKDPVELSTCMDKNKVAISALPAEFQDAVDVAYNSREADIKSGNLAPVGEVFNGVEDSRIRATKLKEEMDRCSNPLELSNWVVANMPTVQNLKGQAQGISDKDRFMGYIVEKRKALYEAAGNNMEAG